MIINAKIDQYEETEWVAGLSYILGISKLASPIF